MKTKPKKVKSLVREVPVLNDPKHAKKDFAVKHPPVLKPKNKHAR